MCSQFPHCELAVKKSSVAAEEKKVRDEYLDGTYLDLNKSWHIEDSPWKAQQILRMMRRSGVEPKTIAEAGCGAGEILRQLSLALPQAEFDGFELSPDAFQLCQQRSNERLHFHLADASRCGRKFDLCLCIDVFEHVEDYMGFLRALREVAGFKIFHIPLDTYVLSVLRKTPMATRKWVGHLHYFTPETAVATLVDCGYDVLDQFFTKSFDGAPSYSLENRLLRIPRRMFSSISPRMTQTWLGGHSLLVLAR